MEALLRKKPKDKGEVHNFLAYFCVMADDIKGGLSNLKAAIKIDKSYLQDALDDADLKPLWPGLEKKPHVRPAG
jgi:hypothetical protein